MIGTGVRWCFVSICRVRLATSSTMGLIGGRSVTRFAAPTRGGGSKLIFAEGTESKVVAVRNALEND